RYAVTHSLRYVNSPRLRERVDRSNRPGWAGEFEHGAGVGAGVPVGAHSGDVVDGARVNVVAGEEPRGDVEVDYLADDVVGGERAVSVGDDAEESGLDRQR